MASEKSGKDRLWGVFGGPFVAIVGEEDEEGETQKR